MKLSGERACGAGKSPHRLSSGSDAAPLLCRFYENDRYYYEVVYIRPSLKDRTYIALIVLFMSDTCCFRDHAVNILPVFHPLQPALWYTSSVNVAEYQEHHTAAHRYPVRLEGCQNGPYSQHLFGVGRGMILDYRAMRTMAYWRQPKHIGVWLARGALKSLVMIIAVTTVATLAVLTVVFKEQAVYFLHSASQWMPE